MEEKKKNREIVEEEKTPPPPPTNPIMHPPLRMILSKLKEDVSRSELVPWTCGVWTNNVFTACRRCQDRPPLQIHASSSNHLLGVG